jgi:Pyridine nucleotide-disulphide oxidoreductase, dimerisation domain
VNGRSPLTHVGKHQAAVLAQLLLGQRTTGLVDDGLARRVIFIESQIAAVGLGLEAGLGAALDARAYDAPSSSTARASFHGRGEPGTSRLVVDEHAGGVVGATFVGSDVAEWLHAAPIAIAIVSRSPVERAIPAFPTWSEIWLTLLEQPGRSSRRSAPRPCTRTTPDRRRQRVRRDSYRRHHQDMGSTMNNKMTATGSDLNGLLLACGSAG